MNHYPPTAWDRPTGGRDGARPAAPPAYLLLTLTLGLLAWAAGCSAPGNRAPAEAAAPLGTGHFEGTVQLNGSGPGQSFKLALDLRHPRPGHYEAEVVAPSRPSLSFVADTVDFRAPTLRLARPALPGQRLTLTREGDFWRGTLALDSVQVPVLLLRRGPTAPAVYRVSRPPLAARSAGALLFAPADESTAGPALALLPAAADATLAPRWADALARAGIIVLLLPAPAAALDANIDAAPSTSSPTPTDPNAADGPATLAALRQLRRTPGADTARLGVWATAGRAAHLLAGGPKLDSLRLNFLVVQQLEGIRALRPALRRLGRAGGADVLGLYEAGNAAGRRNSAALRAALPRRARHRVRVLPATEAAAAVAEWLGPAGP